MSGPSARETPRHFPVVQCPGCRLSMAVAVAEVEKDGLEIITYRCTSCDIETQRQQKRPT